jgi:hypothetical protein
MPCRCCNFKQVRDQSTLLDKVQVAAGDISLPGLGLDEQTRQVLISNLHFIIHCAADIRLEADIQVGFCSCHRLQLQGSLQQAAHIVESEQSGRQGILLCGFLAKLDDAQQQLLHHMKHAARLDSMMYSAWSY